MNQCSVTYFSKAFLTLKCRLWGKQVWAVLAKGHQASTTLERNFSRQALLCFLLLHHNFTELSLSGLACPFQARNFASVPHGPSGLQEAEGLADGMSAAGMGSCGSLLSSSLLGCGVWGRCHHPMELSSRLGWHVPSSPPSRASRRTRAPQGCSGSTALTFPLVTFVAHSGKLEGKCSSRWRIVIFRNVWVVSFLFLMVTMNHYQRQKTAGNTLLFKIQQLSSLCITNSQRTTNSSVANY